MTGVAWSHLRTGLLDAASDSAREAVVVGERIGQQYLTAFPLVVLGLVAHDSGNPAEGRVRLAEALRRSHAADSPLGTAFALEAFAAVALNTGDVRRAILLGSPARLREHTVSGGVTFALATLADEPLERARMMTKPAEFEAAVGAGKALSTSEAVALALEADSLSLGESTQSGGAVGRTGQRRA